MLVLTRRLQEKIHIGPDIVITVVDIQPGRVRIGIEAPKSIHIVRDELLGKEPPKDKQGDVK